MNICLSMLRWYFPEDTLWRDGVAEWVGYSPSTNQFIVISDGTCRAFDDRCIWLVHIYIPKKPLTTFSEILKNKYWDEEDADKIKEEWMEFKFKK